MRHHAGRMASGAPMVTLARAVLVQLISGEKTLSAALEEGTVSIDGDPTSFDALLSWLDRFDFWFEIIEP